MDCKNVTTALTIVLPSQFHDDINIIRQKHDRAYPRWAPHINLRFPFVDVVHFADVEKKLSRAFAGANLRSFTVKLTKLAHFKQSGGKTFHLTTDDSKALAELSALIESALGLPSSGREFQPHVTLAQCKNKDTDTMLAELNQWFNGKTLEFVVDRVCLLSRTPTSPFAVANEIKFP